MTHKGPMRVYFNRHGAEPLMWCVADASGQWEMAVRGVDIRTSCTTVYEEKAVPDDEDGKPSAWIAVAGELEILPEGYAQIR